MVVSVVVDAEDGYRLRIDRDRLQWWQQIDGSIMRVLDRS